MLLLRFLFNPGLMRRLKPAVSRRRVRAFLRPVNLGPEPIDSGYPGKARDVFRPTTSCRRGRDTAECKVSATIRCSISIRVTNPSSQMKAEMESYC